MELYSNKLPNQATNLPLIIMDDGAQAPSKYMSPSRKENPNGFKEQDGYGKKYGHIENFTTATMENMRCMLTYTNAVICILPKLDGTHCSFEWPPRAMDVKVGLVVSACKRTGFIGDATGESEGSEKFFAPGFPTLIKTIQGAILDLCQKINGTTKNIAKIRVHGEVVGGYYPHVDVHEEDGTSKRCNLSQGPQRQEQHYLRRCCEDRCRRVFGHHSMANDHRGAGKPFRDNTRTCRVQGHSPTNCPGSGRSCSSAEDPHGCHPCTRIQVR